VQAFGIAIHVSVLMEEVDEPAQDFIDLCHKCDFISVEVVEGVRVSDVVDSEGTCQLDVAKTFVHRGDDFKDQLEPETTGKDGVWGVVRRTDAFANPSEA
jgi:hypothetical protein